MNRAAATATALAAALLTLLPVLWLATRALDGEGALGALLSPSSTALLLRSAGLAIAVGALATAGALVLAATTSAVDAPLRRALHVLVLLPLAVPCYVGASAAIALVSPRGALGALAGSVGARLPPLQGFGAAVVVLTVFTLPLAYLPLRAALVRVDASTYEAARTLGRGPFAALLVAVRPALVPALVQGATLSSLYALSEFGAVSLLRVDTFPRVIYLQFLSAFDRAEAARSSLLLVLLVVVFVVVLARFGRAPRHASARERPLAIRLGPLRFVGAALAILYCLAGALVPVVGIVWWIRPSTFARLAWLPRALGASLAIGIAAGLVGTALAVVVARAVERRGGVVERAAAQVIAAGFALPGLVVALGLTFFALQAAPFLRSGYALVFLAMLVLHLPLALAAVRPVVGGVPPALEEAARVLGDGPRRAFLRVVAPLVLPGAVASAFLVAASTMKELSATLLLLPPGGTTLATRLWAATEEAMYAEAALPALLLILLSATAAFVLDPRRHA